MAGFFMYLLFILKFKTEQAEEFSVWRSSQGLVLMKKMERRKESWLPQRSFPLLETLELYTERF